MNALLNTCVTRSQTKSFLKVRACHQHQNVKVKLKSSGRKRKDVCRKECLKISDLFGKAPTGDSDTKANCGVDLANVSLLFTDEVTFPTS